MNRFFLLMAVITVYSIQSCSRNSFVVAPPFTNVKKITQLNKGMTIAEVSTILGIDPYDVLYTNDSESICYFNYRILDRKIPILNTMDSQTESQIDSLNLSSDVAQVYGKKFYSEWKKLYVGFKDGKLVNYISSTGMEDSKYILFAHGQIKLLSKKDLEFSHFSKANTTLIYGTPSTGTAVTPATSNKDNELILENLLFPLNNDGTFDNKSKRKEKEKEEYYK
jgi:hypothetical protein